MAPSNHDVLFVVAQLSLYVSCYWGHLEDSVYSFSIWLSCTYLLTLVLDQTMQNESNGSLCALSVVY